MAEAAPKDKLSLTGVWHGLFSYPRLYEPTSFVAVLIDSGSSFSGTTHEPLPSNQGSGGLLYAMLQGKRDGGAISFIKTYDGTSGWSHTVTYEGTLNREATEIEGRWYLADAWSGKFLMVRAGAKEEEAARKTALPADST